MAGRHVGHEAASRRKETGTSRRRFFLTETLCPLARVYVYLPALLWSRLLSHVAPIWTDDNC
jgi:hypothetical protein